MSFCLVITATACAGSQEPPVSARSLYAVPSGLIGSTIESTDAAPQPVSMETPTLVSVPVAGAADGFTEDPLLWDVAVVHEAEPSAPPPPPVEPVPETEPSSVTSSTNPAPTLIDAPLPEIEPSPPPRIPAETSPGCPVPSDLWNSWVAMGQEVRDEVLAAGGICLEVASNAWGDGKEHYGTAVWRMGRFWVTISQAMWPGDLLYDVLLHELGHVVPWSQRSARMAYSLSTPVGDPLPGLVVSATVGSSGGVDGTLVVPVPFDLFDHDRLTANTGYSWSYYAGPSVDLARTVVTFSGIRPFPGDSALFSYVELGAVSDHECLADAWAASRGASWLYYTARGDC